VQNYLSHAFFNELVIQWSGKQSKTHAVKKQHADWKENLPEQKQKFRPVNSNLCFMLHKIMWIQLRQLCSCYGCGHAIQKNLRFTFTIGLPSTCRACLCIFCRKIRCLSIGIWWTLHCAISYKWLSYSVCRKQKTAKLLENTSLLIHLPQMVWNWDPIYKISYNNLTIMPKLRSTYDGRLIYKTSYEEHKAFLRYDSLAKS